MENGMQTTLQNSEDMIFQNAIVGHLGLPVKISALQEKEQGLTEKEVALWEKFSDSWMKEKKKISPNGLSMKMLRECCLATEDLTISQSSLKWTNEGTILNGKILTHHGLSRKIENEYTLSDILEDMADARYFLSKEQTEKLVVW